MIKEDRGDRLAGHDGGKPGKRSDARNEQQRRRDHDDTDCSACPNPPRQLLDGRAKRGWEISTDDRDHEQDGSATSERDQRCLQRMPDVGSKRTVDARLNTEQTTRG